MALAPASAARMGVSPKAVGSNHTGTLTGRSSAGTANRPPVPTAAAPMEAGTRSSSR